MEILKWKYILGTIVNLINAAQISYENTQHINYTYSIYLCQKTFWVYNFKTVSETSPPFVVGELGIVVILLLVREDIYLVLL